MKSLVYETVVNWILICILFKAISAELIKKPNGMISLHLTSNGSWGVMDVEETEGINSPFILSDPESSAPACECGCTHKGPEKRIIGGDFYPPNTYPFLVSIAVKVADVYSPFCGGSLITPTHVLTAAHCTEIHLTETLYALFGTHNGNTPNPIAVNKFVQHENYDPSANYLHDIAILFLASSAINTIDIACPVCMPEPFEDETGITVKILGWGAEKRGGKMTVLPKEMSATVFPRIQCNNAWGKKVCSATQICTFSPTSSACKGDSGGPVVTLNTNSNRYTLVGIVSFGLDCNLKVPSIETRVGYYIPWILKALEGDTDQPCFQK